MEKTWWLCPVCEQKLLMIDKSKKIEGVFVICKRHGKEVEIKNEPGSEPTT